MSLTLGMVTVDTTDALGLARWWSTQLGGEIVEENDGWFVVVSVPDSPALGFQKVDYPTPGKNKLHLDLAATDMAAAVDKLVEAGADKVADQSAGDLRWVTLADPDGNYFDVAQTPT